MTNRSELQSLTDEEIDVFLKEEKVVCISTVNKDGTPYTVPVNYVYENGKLYFHGSQNGQKMDNIRNNGNVSAAVYSMDYVLPSEVGNPCRSNTKYRSIIIKGKAEIVSSIEEKKMILSKIVNKYTPQLNGKEMPQEAIEKTAVVVLDCIEITGKYGGR